MYNFDDIVKMHEYLYPNLYDRVRMDELEIMIVNSLLSSFWNNVNKTTLLSDTLNLCASISCLQPFWDGNFHLAKLLLVNILNLYNYNINYDDIKDTHIIPLYYNFNEGIMKSDIEKYNKIIKSRKY